MFTSDTSPEVGHELALEGEAHAVVLALLVVVHHVLEAAPLHERHPLCRLARLLQRLAPQERPPFSVLHAVLPQELQIESLLVGVEVLVLLVGHNAVIFYYVGKQSIIFAIYEAVVFMCFLYVLFHILICVIQKMPSRLQTKH